MVSHMDDLLTSTEAGQIIGKSARTVQRMAESGELPVAQKLPGPNGAYLFRRTEIEALVPAERAS
jgi:predicted DNA-binding transcriptional regulator AlpA